MAKKREGDPRVPRQKNDPPVRNRRIDPARIVAIIGLIASITVLILDVLLWIQPFNPISPFPKITSTASQTLPKFPWPPPKPSAIAELTLGSLEKLAGAGLDFGNVDARITIALFAGGYDDKSYFGVPNGFAIATRLERINSDGYPDNANRWLSELKPINITEFSLGKYFEALFSARKGHYRVFIFFVTSDLVVQSGTPVSQSEAKTWVVEGANKLPSAMKSIPYTKDYTCTVYIYEFIQSGIGEKANQNIPSEITGKEHLERAGLWDALEK